MRRTPFVLTATAAGLAGVLSYHTHAKSFGGFNPTPAQAGATPQRAQPHTSQSQTSTAASSGQGTVTAPVTPWVGRQRTGPLVQYGYGVLAVKVTLSGPKITSVGVVGLQTDSQYSQSLAQQVIPMLRSEVLQLQSANINGVSGATYTSEAFAMSLQRAIQHLHP
jgi:uncharacterized protein with FMN-binding domain